MDFLFSIFLVVLSILALVCAPMALMLGVIYVLGPGVFYVSHKMPARPSPVPLPIESFRPAARAYASASVRALREDGFEAVSSLCLPRQLPGMTVYIVLMRRPSTGDQATVAAILDARGLTLHPRAQYVEFSTLFSSGRRIATLNCDASSALLLAPHTLRTALPGVLDLRTLYQMHRYICRDNASGSQARPPEECEPSLALSRALAEDYQARQADGMLWLDKECQLFRLTYKGACLLCWSQLWPVTSARRWLARTAASRRLDGFEGTRASTWGRAERD